MGLKQLYHDLVRFETELWDAVDARLRAECDLQLTWFEVMRLPARRPGCRIQDIAEEFAITVGGTSKVVDRVEAAGYCRRRTNPDDRRSSLVELTPAGTRLTNKATEVFEAELDRRVGSVVPEQALEQFAVTLSALRAAGQAMTK
ncbi:MarR family winged helix-turn-helix transcriptional regulator [Streptomyces sp. NPDC002845]